MVNGNTKGLNKGIKVQKDNRSMQEQLNEMRSVLRGALAALDTVYSCNLDAYPISVSGNPKYGSFGMWRSKYNDEGEMIRK